MTEETKAPAPAPKPPAQDDDPNIIGNLSEEELAQWAKARQMGNQTVMELGNMVVRMVRSVNQIDRAEAEVRTMLQGAAKRLGLADDVKFQALPDGRIRVLADIQPVAPATKTPEAETPADKETGDAAAETKPDAKVDPKEAESKDDVEAEPEVDPMEAVAKAKAAVDSDEGAETPPPA